MNAIFKMSELGNRYLAVICGGMAAAALHATIVKTPLVQLDLAGVLLLLLFMAALWLAIWGMFTSNAQPKSRHFSDRLTDAGPSFAGVLILIGSLWNQGAAAALLPIWFLAVIILFRLINRIEGERNHDAVFKRALEDYEEIIDGRLWSTKGAEIVASDRCDHPRATGPVKYEHICRTINGSWFIFRVEAKHGRIVLCKLTPCNETEAKWRLESHHNAYVRFFGQPTSA